MRLRKIIWQFQDFMARRRIAKACPEFDRLARKRVELRSKHRAIRDVERRQRAVMNRLLSAERWL